MIYFKKKNPFDISFGKIPPVYVARIKDVNKVLTTFTELQDFERIITGTRGSGKTVLMTDITERISEYPDWIVTKISPLDDILDALYRNLQNNEKFGFDHLEANYGLSFLGASVNVTSRKPEVNLIDAIDKTLEVLQKNNMKVLVAIDEVTNTPQMQKFASAFQLFISNNRPICFLATGLYDEIMSLQDINNLTFLYRAPKIILAPLNRFAVAKSYSSIFDIGLEKASKLSDLTQGYPFAFQTLGYVCWDHKTCDISDEMMYEYDQLLADASYSKLWSELSDLDRQVLWAIAQNNGGKVKDFREKLGMNPNKFNQYRRRLKNQGLIDTSQYGSISFALPRFAEFVKYEME